ncbi:TPA_asm: maturation protein, partial [ssRNA phage Gerhypos.4_28]
IRLGSYRWPLLTLTGATLGAGMPVIAKTNIITYATDNYIMSGNVAGASVHNRVTANTTTTRVTSSNPQWRQQVRNGRNATTPYSVTSPDQLSVPVKAFCLTFDPHKNGGVPVRYYVSQHRFGASPDNPAGYNYGSVDLQARQSFVSNYRSRRTQFQSGTFFGELAETVRQIRSPAQALRNSINDYYTDVKHGLKRLHRGASRNKYVQNSWLEYSYGVKPLVGDIADAIGLACADPFAYRQVIHGSATLKWKGPVTAKSNTPTVIGGVLNWTEKSWLENELSVRYKGAVRAENSPPGFPEQLGLSWSNVLPTIWELIPYSFLVDYFTNVGKVIEGISTGRIFLSWGCRTQRGVSEAKVATELNSERVTANYGSSMWTGYATGFGSSATYKYVTRSGLDSIGVSFADASFKLPGTNTRWLNIAALASLRT